MAETNGRRYWVVSPNVRNREETVSEWRAACLRERAAFMGWGVNDYAHKQIGPKFAGKHNGIKPGDVILIARRHGGEPEIVGFGVVEGDYSTKAKGATPPEGFSSLRWLSPFKPWSRAPKDVPLIDCLRHTRALAKLHPKSNISHRRVSEWIESKLNEQERTQRGVAHPPTPPRKISREVTKVDLPTNFQLDYKFRTRRKIARARRREQQLLHDYQQWLLKQERQLIAAKYQQLRCDGYEEARHNLIEAKSSASREHIRMAVGQLLDYAFQGKTKLGELNKAILLPKKPEQDSIAWLKPLNIAVIWPEESNFLDTANGLFT
jgi:hypothetical protein